MARTKGSLNRRTVENLEIAERLGVDPLVVMFLFAKGDFEALGYEKFQPKFGPNGAVIDELTISPELRLKAAIEAARYMRPQLKSVQVSGDAGGEPIQLKYAVSGEIETGDDADQSE